MVNTEYNGTIIHFNRVYDYDRQGAETESILMTHPIYFLQNGYDELVKIDVDKIKEWYLDPIKAAKALLMLHSIPFNYGNPKIGSFFNSDSASNVGYEIMPYGMLALMGGLLYRVMYFNETNTDIINTYDVYKKPGISETFLVNGKKGIHFGVIKDGSSKEYLPISTILKDNIDVYVKNKLIELFINFVQETSSLMDSIEIKPVSKIIIGEQTVKKITGWKNKNTGAVISTDEYDSGAVNSSDYESVIGDVQIPLYETRITRYTYKSFSKMVQSMITKNFAEVSTYLMDESKVTGFSVNYMVGLIRNGKLWMYYREDAINLQMFFDKLYNHRCGVLTLVCQKGLNSDCVINESSFNAVVNGFTSTMKEMLSSYDKDNENKESGDIVESKNSADDDLKKSVYLFMKQFWDKWLCSIYNDTDKYYDKTDVKPFTVDWFNNQFLFIDSFYNDISSKLKLDCKELKSMYDSVTSGDSVSGIHVLNHLANVAEIHQCNFFCYPDFINFRKVGKDGNKENPVQILSDLFKPIPYNNLNRVEAQNQFVIIRKTGSQITGNKLQYNNDGFDIWCDDNGTAVAPTTFQSSISNYESDDDNIRMAYKVPAFGVAFSRQNNSLFKSIDIGMDTQQITEQSIKSLCYISQLGNSNKRAVTFYGNDIYGVYSAYSYIVTITMMGDAQIQPLMYFQLMNIPMFRGTYMVIEVKHSLKVGEFTTTFRGMKMSKIEPPYSSAWFTIEPEESDAKNSTTDDCGKTIVNSDGTPIVNGDDKYEISKDKTGKLSTWKFTFDVKNMRFACRTADNNGIPYGPTHVNIPNPEECPDVKMMVVGLNFVSGYDTGNMECDMVVGGKIWKGKDNSKNYGGLVVYKNGSYKFCDNRVNYQTELASGNVMWSYSNYMMVTNGVVNYNLVSSGSYQFQCIAERHDGRFQFITTTNVCDYKSFAKYIDSLNFKNVIYKDTWSGGCYGWARENGGIYKWGGSKNNNGTSTIMYII